MTRLVANTVNFTSAVFVLAEVIIDVNIVLRPSLLDIPTSGIYKKSYEFC